MNNEEKKQKKKEPLKNFSFVNPIDNKTCWYSRAMTSVVIVYCWSKEYNEWCVLADLRGKAVKSCKNRWNVQSGYLSFNERISVVWNDKEVDFDIDDPKNFGCSRRKCYEETGIIIPGKCIHFYHLNTTPYGEKQNLSCKFYAILPQDVSYYRLTSENAPEGTVADIKWIPMSQLHSYKFAFKQIPMIEEIYDRYVNISIFRKMMIKIMRWMERKYGNPKLV